jgi:hypothetical protein
VVTLLLKDTRVDPTTNGHHALCRACDGGHAEVAALLLKDQRVDLTTKKQRCSPSSCSKTYRDCEVDRRAPRQKERG